MQNFDIKTDTNGKELVEHGSSMFPIAGYDEYFSRFILGQVPWHRHEEIELIIVLAGSTRVIYIDGFTDLQTDEGIFINSNVFHRLIQTSRDDCHIINFVLRPEFIGGRNDSTIYLKYVKPICANPALSVIKFDPTIDYEKYILDQIRLAFDAYTESAFGFEMEVLSSLTLAWQALCRNHSNIFEWTAPQNEYQERMNTIIQFIHAHYNKKIFVGMLAAEASISESECYRLFRKTIHMTPIEYLIQHRLQRTLILLLESNRSILDISESVGFSSPSYFTLKFKAHYHCTPKQFRKKHADTLKAKSLGYKT